MKYGYKNEQDMFICRAVLELLQRDGTTDNAKKFRASIEWKEKSVALNFIDQLFDVLEMGDFTFYKEYLARYQLLFHRDYTFFE